MTLIIIAALISIFGFGISFTVLDMTLGQAGHERKRYHNRSLEITPGGTKTSIVKDEGLSEIKFLNKLLKKQAFTAKLNQLLEMTGWKISVGLFVMVSLLLTLILYAALLSLKMSPLQSVICSGLAIILVPYTLLCIHRKRYLDKFSLHFPKALQLIRSALNAGLGLPTSLQRVALDAPHPVCKEFDLLMKEIALGRTLAEALINMQKRLPTPDVKTFVIAITVQQEAGGNLTELIKNLEETILAKVLMRKELHVLTSQARLSGWILALLPLLLTVLLKVVNPHYLDLLFLEETGRKLLMYTVILQVVGFVAIKKMVTIKISA